MVADPVDGPVLGHQPGDLVEIVGNPVGPALLHRLARGAAGEPGVDLDVPGRLLGEIVLADVVLLVDGHPLQALLAGGQGPGEEERLPGADGKDQDFAVLHRGGGRFGGAELLPVLGGVVGSGGEGGVDGMDGHGKPPGLGFSRINRGCSRILLLWLSPAAESAGHLRAAGAAEGAADVAAGIDQGRQRRRPSRCRGRRAVDQIFAGQVSRGARGVGAAAEPRHRAVDRRRPPVRGRRGRWPGPGRRCRGSGVPGAPPARWRRPSRSAPGPGPACRRRWCPPGRFRSSPAPAGAGRRRRPPRVPPPLRRGSRGRRRRSPAPGCLARARGGDGGRSAPGSRRWSS